MLTMQKRIEDKLISEINPETLEVINESHKHKGHAGDDGSGESHFVIKVKADKLSSLGKLQSHRVLNDALKDELRVIHSISFILD